MKDEGLLAIIGTTGRTFYVMDVPYIISSQFGFSIVFIGCFIIYKSLKVLKNDHLKEKDERLKQLKISEEGKEVA